MKDIVLNGISITTLKNQRKAVRQDAAKFVADNISQVKVLVNKIIEQDADSTVDV
jgi:hypothetical protein